LTPLLRAAANKHGAVVRLLLDKGDHSADLTQVVAADTAISGDQPRTETQIYGTRERSCSLPRCIDAVNAIHSMLVNCIAMEWGKRDAVN